MQTLTTSLFIYKAKNCHNESQLVTAIDYYQSVQMDMDDDELITYDQIMDSLETKLALYRSQPLADNTAGLLNKDRLFYYHKSIILSVELLKKKPNGALLDQLFCCLQESLKIAGSEWNVPTMYTDNVTFGESYTTEEKVIYTINKLMASGLHKDKTIIYVTNLFIKLVNIRDIRDLLSLHLPNRRDLHNVSFVIPDYKY